MSTDYWEHLNHGGLLLSPQALSAWFSTQLPPVPEALVARIDRVLTPLLAASNANARGDALPLVLDTLFEDLLGLERTRWRKGPQQVDDVWQRRLASGENLRPSRLWLGPRNEVTPLFVVPREGRVLSLASNRRPLARILAWARLTRLPLVLVTNGAELRLYHVGPDWEAYCEWSFDRLLDQGEPAPQLTALRHLLSFNALTADRQDAPPRLVQAVRDSRKGHADLSSTLGERVRQGVEELVRSFGQELSDAIDANQFPATDAYIAATRLVMRVVIILFAEARGLLPVDHPVYADAYGLQSLRVQLGRVPTERLRQRQQAWARLLGLFRLVHDGSHHEALPVTAYGGGLFAPGILNGPDGVLRAMAFFENPRHAPSDATVMRLLELIAMSRVKVRQGRQTAWIQSPVDFAGLETEYIGILYEGLLDYELRRVPDTDPIIFLQTAAEPALPFSRVNDMSNDELKKLFDGFKKAAKNSSASDDEDASDDDTSDEDSLDSDSDDDADTDGETPEDAISDDSGAETGDEEDDASPGEADTPAVWRTWVQDWAERAVKAVKMVTPPKRSNKPNPAEHDRYNADVTRAAKRLYKLVLPGQWYLVRWGGTRKGAGTFYTRPQLAAPTVARTLRPLAFTPTTKTTSARGIVFDDGWIPKTPDAILRIKLCDPACGSGAFLISSLRFLTDALVQSLEFHQRIGATTDDADSTRYRIAEPTATEPAWDETLPVPTHHPDFEGRLRARLKRHVVEHCIYGVDLDPLAVELGRLALWIETLDRDLPFGFIDHKVRPGNALVGAWLDTFQDYPLAAWERKAGDEDHTRFVHHRRTVLGSRGKTAGIEQTSGDPWAAALKERRSEIHSELGSWLSGDLLRTGSALVPTDVHGRAMKAWRALHRVAPNNPAAAATAFEKLRTDKDFAALRQAFDGWCALWFWPCDQLDVAPGPMAFASGAISDEALAIVQNVAAKQRFFHWELAFPDVFSAERRGFDAIVGNPPWEIQKPNSKEFFSAIDPLYRSYGKQEALKQQVDYFERSSDDERAWIAYCGELKARSNWVRWAAFPTGNDPSGMIPIGSNRNDAGTERQHSWARRRPTRKGYADSAHAFRHQGSADLNTYKMFLEQGHALLAPEGRLGMIVPSGVYTDKGTTDLRRLFLEHCQWEWLFSFENREKIFDIHRSFKFGPVIVVKASSVNDAPMKSPTLAHAGSHASGTTAIHVAFMRRSLEDWDDAESYALDYPRARVEQFSPTSRAILEIQDLRDLEVLTKLYTNGVLLGDQSERGWGIKYAREFDMTNDSKLFPPRPKWEADGYQPDEYGHWLRGDWRPITDFGWNPTHRKEPQYGHWLILDRPQDVILSRDGQSAIHLDNVEGVALPLYEGRMINQFDYSEKGWVSGKGRSAVWREIPTDSKVIEPQYLMDSGIFNSRAEAGSVRIGFLAIGSATNRRSMFAAITPSAPHGNSVPVIQAREAPASLVALLNSFAYDYALRARLGGVNLNWHVIEETPTLGPTCESGAWSSNTIAAIGMSQVCFASSWRTIAALKDTSWRENWILTRYSRISSRAKSDALIAHAFGLDSELFHWVLNECELPTGVGRNAKGFWRVDKDKPPELRHTVLAQVAFRDLQRMGLDAFLSQNDGEGWMLPETLRLADYGLGHDDRAKEHQPVASALGPRFYDWQLAQDPAESWQECEAHAALIERIRSWQDPDAPTDGAPRKGKKTNKAAKPAKNPTQASLFGDGPK